MSTPEERARWRAIWHRNYADPEYRRKRAEYQRRYYARPESKLRVRLRGIARETAIETGRTTDDVFCVLWAGR